MFRPEPGTVEPALGLPRRRAGRWRRRFARISGAGSYPRGWLLVLVRSRAAPWLARVLALALVVFAALPDAGIGIPSAVYLAMLAVLYVAAEALRAMVHGADLDAYAAASVTVAFVISALAGKSARSRAASDDEHDVPRSPSSAVPVLLRKAKELVCDTMKVPAGEEVTANLLLPERDGQGDVIGLRTVERDDLQPHRWPDPVPLDAPGAGTTFRSGEAVAVPYTEIEEHPRIFGRTYRSIAAFPIAVGTRGRNGAIVGVLSIDSTKPYRFTSSTVRKLNPFIWPIAQRTG